MTVVVVVTEFLVGKKKQEINTIWRTQNNIIMIAVDKVG